MWAPLGLCWVLRLILGRKLGVRVGTAASIGRRAVGLMTFTLCVSCANAVFGVPTGVARVIGCASDGNSSGAPLFPMVAG